MLFVGRNFSAGLGKSKLARYVLPRLPKNYLLTDDDLPWLDECDGYLTVPPTNESLTAATKQAVAADPTGHIDPFELLIDANICDSNCEPCRRRAPSLRILGA
jgi:hypothetical protein